LRSRAVKPVADECDRGPRRASYMRRFPSGGSTWLLHACRSSPTGNGHVTAPLRMEQSVDVTGGPSQLVHLSSVVGGAAGAGSVARATAPGRLLAGTSEAIGKRLRNGPSAPAPYPSSCQSGTPSRSATAAGSPTTRRVSRLARSGINRAWILRPGLTSARASGLEASFGSWRIGSGRS